MVHKLRPLNADGKLWAFRMRMADWVPQPFTYHAYRKPRGASQADPSLVLMRPWGGACPHGVSQMHATHVRAEVCGKLCAGCARCAPREDRACAMRGRNEAPATGGVATPTQATNRQVTRETAAAVLPGGPSRATKSQVKREAALETTHTARPAYSEEQHPPRAGRNVPNRGSRTARAQPPQRTRRARHRGKRPMWRGRHPSKCARPTQL